MPKSRIKHTATGTRSRETESDSEIPSVSTPISLDHLFLLKMLPGCYLRSFKVRGFISSLTVSMLAKHLPCLLLSAVPAHQGPRLPRPVSSFDNYIEHKNLWWRSLVFLFIGKLVK